jgi:hypothetical protein
VGGTVNPLMLIIAIIYILAMMALLTMIQFFLKTQQISTAAKIVFFCLLGFELLCTAIWVYQIIETGSIILPFIGNHSLSPGMLWREKV